MSCAESQHDLDGTRLAHAASRQLREIEHSLRRTNPAFKLGIQSHVPVVLRDLILSCTSFDPQSRPSFKQACLPLTTWARFFVRRCFVRTC